MQADNLPAFIRRFDEAVRNQLDGEDLIPETVYDTGLELGQVSLDTVDRLEQLAPFGLGNPAPVFLFRDLDLVTARAVGSDQAHLKLTVAQQGSVREGIAFSQGKALPGLGKQVALVGSVDRNEFNGRVSAQLKVKALLPGSQAFTADAPRAASFADGFAAGGAAITRRGRRLGGTAGGARDGGAGGGSGAVGFAGTSGARGSATAGDGAAGEAHPSGAERQGARRDRVRLLG